MCVWEEKFGRSRTGRKAIPRPCTRLFSRRSSKCRLAIAPARARERALTSGTAKTHVVHVEYEKDLVDYEVQTYSHRGAKQGSKEGTTTSIGGGGGRSHVALSHARSRA